MNSDGARRTHRDRLPCQIHPRQRVGVVEKVVAKHIEHRCDAHDGAKQLGPLRERGSHEQPRIRAPENRELLGVVRPVWMSHSAADEEVIVGDLTIRRLAASCHSAPNSDPPRMFGQREQTPVFEKKRDKDAELRRH